METRCGCTRNFNAGNLVSRDRHAPAAARPIRYLRDHRQAAKLEQQAKAGMLKTSAPKVSLKGIVVSLVSGLLMGSFYPLVELGKGFGAGMGPYAIGFVFALGIFTSTFVFNLFFMNLPVAGEPLELPDYFKGLPKQHLLGVAGGILWCAGMIANFVGSSAPEAVVLIVCAPWSDMLDPRSCHDLAPTSGTFTMLVRLALSRRELTMLLLMR